MYHDPAGATRFQGRCSVQSGQNPDGRHFLFLLLPGANMLDFAAAIEPLRVCNAVLDQKAYAWSVLSEDGLPVACSNGLQFPVDGAPERTRSADCIVVCSGDSGHLKASHRTLQWLRKHARFGGRVAALGTGAFTIARAGLANDKQLSLHWPHIPVFNAMFPEVACVSTRTVADKSVTSGAGGSASVDFALSAIQEDFDEATAQRVAELCLHEFDGNYTRAQRHPVSKRVGSRHPAVVNIVKRMEQSVQNPMTLEEIINEENISKRQVERLFSRYLDTTPAKYYRNLRLDRARALLQGTDMSVLEVAVTTGFTSTANFSKLYRARFGERPAVDRKATSDVDALTA